MKRVKEGALEFVFPDKETQVLKFDDSNLYRNHLQKVSPQRRGADILCLMPDQALWLIEIKDYRLDAVEQDRSTLPNVIVDKVLDTLAGLCCAKSMNCEEAEFASQALKINKVYVVAHVEGLGRLKDDSKHLRKTQTAQGFAADIQVMLRKKFSKLGLSVKVASLEKPLNGCPWTVRSLPFK